MGIWLVAAVLSRGNVFRSLAVFSLVTLFASMAAFVAGVGKVFADVFSD